MDVCGWNCKTLLVNVMLPSEYITCINEHAHSASLERRRPLWKQRCHCRKCHSLYTENQTRVRSSKFLKHIILLPYSSPHQNITRWQQGGICRGDGRTCPDHWISRYGPEWHIVCWCATATRSRPHHWVYLQIPPWMAMIIPIRISLVLLRHQLMFIWIFVELITSFNIVLLQPPVVQFQKVWCRP